MSIRKIFSFLILFFTGTLVYAQSQLRVDSVSGFPYFPGDSVHEVSSYNVAITVVNNDSINPFNDSLDIKYHANSNATATLYFDLGITTIAPLGSIILLDSSFLFTPANFDDGDNIVVVWPLARTTQAVGDSINFHVYFISLIMSSRNIDNESLVLYPNPATNYISFHFPDRNKIKQVRIKDILGQEIYRSNSLQKFISVEKWKPGMYFIVIDNSDGTTQTIKLLKD